MLSGAILLGGNLSPHAGLLLCLHPRRIKTNEAPDDGTNEMEVKKRRKLRERLSFKCHVCDADTRRIGALDDFGTWFCFNFI